MEIRLYGRPARRFNAAGRPTSFLNPSTEQLAHDVGRTYFGRRGAALDDPFLSYQQRVHDPRATSVVLFTILCALSTSKTCNARQLNETLHRIARASFFCASHQRSLSSSHHPKTTTYPCTADGDLPIRLFPLHISMSCA